jgi:hypothetical protein
MEMFMSSRYAKEFAQCILENQGAVFSEESTDKSVINSAFNNLCDYIFQHRAKFNHLPEYTVRSGMTVNIMSTLTYDIAVIYL